MKNIERIFEILGDKITEAEEQNALDDLVIKHQRQEIERLEGELKAIKERENAGQAT